MAGMYVNCEVEISLTRVSSNCGTAISDERIVEVEKHFAANRISFAKEKAVAADVRSDSRFR